MILKKELRTIKKKGLEKIQPDTQKPYQVKWVLFEYSTSREERKEEKAMLKILNELGQMKGHFAVEIFDLENFGLVAVDHDTSNGETMEGWKCDSNGVALDKNTPNFRVKEVQEPISHDEDGEPDQWKIIGFETV